MACVRRRDTVCQSRELVDGGAGCRFTIETGGRTHAAFAVRYQGRVYAYRNVCAHRGVALDWDDGRFFDITGNYLVCSTHGALYDPATGHCAGGPCRGLGLVPVAVTEEDGLVRLASSNDILLTESEVREQTS